MMSDNMSLELFEYGVNSSQEFRPELLEGSSSVVRLPPGTHIQGGANLQLLVATIRERVKAGSLEEVHLPRCVMREDAEEVLRALRGASHLRVLDLRDCPLTANGAEALVDVIRSAPFLTTLNLQECLYLPEVSLHYSPLMEALGDLSYLTALNMTRCYQMEYVEDVARFLVRSESLRVFSFTYNRFGLGGGLRTLARAMGASRLTHVDLSSNGLNDDDVRELMDTLHENEYLEVLKLEDMILLHHHGMQAIIDCLERGGLCSLTHLSLQLTFCPPGYVNRVFDIIEERVERNRRITRAFQSEAVAECLSPLPEAPAGPVYQSLRWGGVLGAVMGTLPGGAMV